MHCCSIKLLQYFSDGLRRFCIADDAETVATIIDLHPQTLLDLSQMLIELTTEIGQPFVIG